MVPKIRAPKLILEQTPGQKSKKHSELQKTPESDSKNNLKFLPVLDSASLNA